MPKSTLSLSNVSEEIILEKIYVIRGQKVMLDRDLAEMYGVEVRRLNEAVKRNVIRFPEDFMFQLAQNEWRNLKSQFATSSWGGIRKSPYAFTEQGVAMSIKRIKFRNGHPGEHSDYPLVHKNETTHFGQQRPLDED